MLYGWALVKDLPFIIILGMPIFLSLLSLATVLISTGSYSGLRGTLSLQLISISPFIQQSVTNLATTTCQGSRHYSRHYRQQSEQVLYVLQWRKHRMDWRHTGENLDSGRESCKEGHPEKAEGSVRNWQQYDWAEREAERPSILQGALKLRRPFGVLLYLNKCLFPQLYGLVPWPSTSGFSPYSYQTPAGTCQTDPAATRVSNQSFSSLVGPAYPLSNCVRMWPLRLPGEEPEVDSERNKHHLGRPPPQQKPPRDQRRPPSRGESHFCGSRGICKPKIPNCIYPKFPILSLRVHLLLY